MKPKPAKTASAHELLARGLNPDDPSSSGVCPKCHHAWCFHPFKVPNAACCTAPGCDCTEKPRSAK